MIDQGCHQRLETIDAFRAKSVTRLVGELVGVSLDTDALLASVLGELPAGRQPPAGGQAVPRRGRPEGRPLSEVKLLCLNINALTWAFFSRLNDSFEVFVAYRRHAFGHL